MNHILFRRKPEIVKGFSLSSVAVGSGVTLKNDPTIQMPNIPNNTPKVDDPIISTNEPTNPILPSGEYDEDDNITISTNQNDDDTPYLIYKKDLLPFGSQKPTLTTPTLKRYKPKFKNYS